MTTIAAVQGSGWAVVGSDSQVTEDSKKFTLKKEFSKLLRNGPYIIGVAGDLRAVNILTHNFSPPTPLRGVGEDELDKFMATKFIPELKACFDKNFYKQDAEQGSSLVVLLRGVVYEVGSDYDFIRDAGGVYSIGTGSAFALGALHALGQQGSNTLARAKERVAAALEASCSYDSMTSAPITIVVQRSEDL